MDGLSKRKKLARYLWSGLVISLAVACVTLVSTILFHGHYHHSYASSKEFSSKSEKLVVEKCVPVCVSEECVHQSKFLNNRMNLTADPCEDFFEFMCGKHEGRVFQNFRREMLRTLKNILENIEEDSGSASGKVKTVYNSCIKQSSTETEAITTVQQFLSELGIPEWPNLDFNFKFANDLNLEEVLGHFLVYKEYGFIDIEGRYIHREEPYSQINTTIIASKSSYGKKKNSTRKYLMKKVLNLFEMDSQTIDKIWEESEALNDAVNHLKEESHRIAKGHDNWQDESVDCNHELKWKSVCKVLETFTDIADVNTGVSKRFAEVPRSSEYFLENIFHMLRNFSDRSIANYLVMNLVFNHLDELNFSLRLALQKDPHSYNKGVQEPGRSSPIDHKQHCISWLSENMYLVLGHEYMKKILTRPVVNEIIDLMAEFTAETSEALSRQEWINQTVRRELEQETNEIRSTMEDYVYALTNETFLNNLYEQFHPTDSSFILNVFKNRRHIKAEEMLGSLQAQDMLWIDSKMLEPNAGGGGISVDLQFGLIFPPLYRVGLQRLINLVSLGSVSIHEIGHILNQDTARLQRTNKELKNYMDELSLCLTNQYSNFKFDHLGKNLNGSRYLHENYADTVAISIIDKLIEKHSSDENQFLLPGFPYSMKQMLYISSVQVWCDSTSKEDEEMNEKFDPHALPKFRMIGMMQNSRGFAEAFHCPEGSFMNPPRKCVFPK